MNDEDVQNEELETTEVVTEVEETGATESEVTANDDVELEAQGEIEGQGEVQSKSRNAKARLRRKLNESEAARAKQAEEYQTRISALENKIEGVVNPPAPRPDRVNFDSEEEYEDTLHDWRATKTVQTDEPVKPPVNQSVQPYQNTPEQQEVIDNWNDSIEDAIDKYDDFDEIVNKNNSLPISPIMGEAIMESDVGTEVVYYLAKNPKVAKGIANLSIVKQISEINELSKKFTKKTSSAPDPLKPVGKGQAASSGKKRHASLEGATFE